ncbi:hypothetical protein K491DRAFT_697713 [Lophiostoma macrostomum CBS 122681]|uniref:F-box domain-containing protein n=1 Tax=Lophiostoma macrostomum CBS 122681 TaxID=1314788 RepID=A0A6A6SQI8_9PLEO|nr:hypothetical protein K491DRAFT_697713 [Lophiostoma macrostomum CBS 122681]
MGNPSASRFERLRLSEKEENRDHKAPITIINNNLRINELVVHRPGQSLGRRKKIRATKVGNGGNQSANTNNPWEDVDDVEEAGLPAVSATQSSPELREPGQRRGFLELPRELRDMIYTYAMTELPTRVLLSEHTRLSEWAFLPQTLPNVSFVSKQFREESILAWLRRTRIVVGGHSYAQYRLGKDLKRFLSFNLPHQDHGLNAIRMLSFLGFEGGENAHDLILCCPGLRSLILTVRSSLYVKSRFPVPTLYTPQELADELNSEPLFKLTSLKHLMISLEVVHCVNPDCCDWTWQQLKEPLRQHLQEGFDKRGGEMKLEIVCKDW